MIPGKIGIGIPIIPIIMRIMPAITERMLLFFIFYFSNRLSLCTNSERVNQYIAYSSNAKGK